MEKTAKSKRLQNFYLLSKIILKVCIYIFIGMIILLSCMTLLQNNFINNKALDLSITNYAFAILIGMTSVTFSYANNIDHDNIQLRKDTSRIAHGFLFTTVIFLFASVVKYFVSTQMQNINFKTDTAFRMYVNICLMFGQVLFLIGFITTLLFVFSLLESLIERFKPDAFVVSKNGQNQ